MRNRNLKGVLFLVSGLVILLINSFRITGGVIGSDFVFSPVNLVAILLIGASIVIFMARRDLEAIIVPTGPSAKADLQRARGGAIEYRKHKKLPHHHDVVIISGEIGDRFFGSKPDKIYRELRRAGIPIKDIILEHASENTMENVLYTCDEIKKRGINEVTVVTDSFHAARFKMLFNRAIKNGYAPKRLKVHTYSEGIESSYSSIKATVAYIKDMFIPLKKGV